MGAYDNCKPCSGSSIDNQQWKYKESVLIPPQTQFLMLLSQDWEHAFDTNAAWKGIRVRLKALSSGEGTPRAYEMGGRNRSQRNPSQVLFYIKLLINTCQLVLVVVFVAQHSARASRRTEVFSWHCFEVTLNRFAFVVAFRNVKIFQL